MPAQGMILRISDASVANERPDEPAPWWVTKSGPLELPAPPPLLLLLLLPLGGVRYTEKVEVVFGGGEMVVVVVVVGGEECRCRCRCREKWTSQGVAVGSALGAVGLL